MKIIDKSKDKRIFKEFRSLPLHSIFKYSNDVDKEKLPFLMKVSDTQYINLGYPSAPYSTCNFASCVVEFESELIILKEKLNC